MSSNNPSEPAVELTPAVVAGIEPFATVDDITALWRPLKPDEVSRAKALLGIVTAELYERANRIGKKDFPYSKGVYFQYVLKSVTVDIVARALMTSTDQEPMTQISESAGGYSASGTFLVPGGGLFIKKSELERLGLLPRQKYGGIDIYGIDKGKNNSPF